jgi:hypothetical protein
MADDFRIIPRGTVLPKTSLEKAQEADEVEEIVEQEQEISDADLEKRFADVYGQFQNVARYLYTTEDLKKNSNNIDTNFSGYRSFQNTPLSQAVEDISATYNWTSTEAAAAAVRNNANLEIREQTIRQMSDEALAEQVNRASELDADFARRMNTAMQLSIVNPTQRWAALPSQDVKFDDSFRDGVSAISNAKTSQRLRAWVNTASTDEVGDFRKGMNQPLHIYVEGARKAAHQANAELPLRLQNEAKAIGELVVGNVWHSNPSAAIMARWRNYVADCKGTLENVDVTAWVQYVLRQCYLGTTDDLHYFAERQRDFVERKKLLRDYYTKLMDFTAQVDAAAAAKKIDLDLDRLTAATGDKDTKKKDAERQVSSDFQDAYFKENRTAIVRTPEQKSLGAQDELPDTIPPETVTNYKELQDYIKDLDSRINAVGDDAQLANMDLQNVLQRQQQLLDLLTNMSKLFYDTAQGVVRNF